MQAKAFNPQIFLEVLCYSVFGVLILYLVSSGKYLSYVTPRMKPYLYFTAIVMLIYAAAGLGRMFRPQYKIRSAHCFVLAIPILFLILPHNPLSTSDLSARYTSGKPFSYPMNRSSFALPQKQTPSGNSKFSTPANTTTQSPANSIADPVNTPSPTIKPDSPSVDTTLPEDNISASIDTTIPDKQPDKIQDNPPGSAGTDVPDKQPDNPYASPGPAASDKQSDKPQDNLSDSKDTAGPNTQSDVSEDEYATDIPGLDIKNKKITVDNDHFYPWICELYSNLEKYSGYHILITGFVFKDQSMSDNEFIPARLTMTCCIADLSPFGLLCQYDKAAELKSDSWITVEGVIHIGKTEYHEEPQITVSKITPAEAVEGYVYPF